MLGKMQGTTKAKVEVIIPLTTCYNKIANGWHIWILNILKKFWIINLVLKRVNVQKITTRALTTWSQLSQRWVILNSKICLCLCLDLQFSSWKRMISNNAVYIFMGKKTYWTPSLNPLPRQKWSEVTSEMHLPTPPPQHNPDSKSYSTQKSQL